MKITFTVSWANAWEEVNAELLDIAPHLADVATFAVHRGALTDGWWWMVSNVETGLKVSYSTVKAEAIRRATKKLAEKTSDDIRLAFQRARRKYPTLKAA